MPWWVGLLVVIVIGLLVARARMARERRFWEAIEPRTPLDEAGFHEQFYRDSDIPRRVSAAVRRIVCAYLDLPTEKMVPDDDFTDRLADVSSLDWTSIFEEVERALGITIAYSDAQDLRPTLRSLTEIVARAYRKTYPA